ncbi:MULTISPECIES: competence protein ComK [Robertmurraya]|uniref:Competence protein ComK n=1 Tax=Robertmurraya beringensis TaxID=641660 RepID=A0ABV6KV17_9BACI
MKMIDSYILTSETLYMKPEIDSNDHVRTMVQEGKESFLVSKSPKRILEETMKYYGFTLEGAINGAKAVLGNYHMVPIVISAPLNMYWFPTQSPASDHCIWMSLVHIEDIVKFDYLNSIVYFKVGNSIIINKKASRLINKQQQTAILKVRTEQRLAKTNAHFMR